jgi:hypothetical protein
MRTQTHDPLRRGITSAARATSTCSLFHRHATTLAPCPRRIRAKSRATERIGWRGKAASQQFIRDGLQLSQKNSHRVSMDAVTEVLEIYCGNSSLTNDGAPSHPSRASNMCSHQSQLAAIRRSTVCRIPPLR